MLKPCLHSASSYSVSFDIQQNNIQPGLFNRYLMIKHDSWFICRKRFAKVPLHISSQYGSKCKTEITRTLLYLMNFWTKDKTSLRSSLFLLGHESQKVKKKQECIPVGCVPPVLYRTGNLCPGPGRVSVQWGLCPGGVSVQGGLCPPHEQNDT